MNDETPGTPVTETAPEKTPRTRVTPQMKIAKIEASIAHHKALIATMEQRKADLIHELKADAAEKAALAAALEGKAD